MVKVIITSNLVKQIKRKFSNVEANKIIDLLETLKTNPSKGKRLTTVGGIDVKEIKYRKFRFYFIMKNLDIKILSREELQNLLIKFVRMSEKKDQQKTIDNIKKILIIDNEDF